MRYYILTQYRRQFKLPKNIKTITGTCLDVSSASGLVVIDIQIKNSLASSEIMKTFVPQNTSNMYIEAIGENDKYVVL